MTIETEIHLESTDYRLGRHVLHDVRSRGFAVAAPVDQSTWVTKTIRIYDPKVNPNQCHGECTGVSKAVQFNAVGNRKTGVVLDMDDAHKIYSRATQLDPFEGEWPPTDTGSCGLAVAKAAQEQGLGGEYRWIFGGADEIVQTIMAGLVVSVGTSWHQDMFHPDASGQVHVTGPVVGGHQWSVRGYDKKTDRLLGRCWWGSFRDFWISRADLQILMDDYGDAHVQERV